MKVLIVGRNGRADRLAQMVKSSGIDPILHARWTTQLEAIAVAADEILIIVDAERRTVGAEHFLRGRPSDSRIAVAYLGPVDPADRLSLDADYPIGFLDPEFDQGDVRSLLAQARAEFTLPTVRVWSLSPTPEDRAKAPVALAGAICAVLAGAIAYRLPGVLQWTAETPPEFYYLVAGLSLLAAGCLMKVSRPIVGGAQVAIVVAIAAMSTTA